jgi:enterobactin synthetase component D
VRAVTALPASLYPAEEALIARAVERRRDEFRAGREAARTALSQLGCAPTAIPAHAERDPVWPGGFVGSIAHAGGVALAVVARAGQFEALGVDVEEAAALEPALVARICRDDERQQAPQLLATGIDFGKLCFVAKEALLKALLPRRRAALRFEQLRLRFDAADHRFCASLHERRTAETGTPIAGLGRYGRCEDLLVAVFSVPVGMRGTES